MDSAVLLTFDELREVVDPWRRDSVIADGDGVSLADVIPPHMTIASPAHSDPLSDAAGGLLQESVEGISPFWLRFSEVATFPHGTVFIAPDHSDDLDRLFQQLADGFRGFGGIRADHVWHLSIARRGGMPLAERFRTSFEPIRVPVEHVAIWTQDEPASPWLMRHRARLTDPAR
ncbi:MAG TPA: 2'-5' RNA ligase family protein [Microlunatus sp.]